MNILRSRALASACLQRWMMNDLTLIAYTQLPQHHYIPQLQQTFFFYLSWAKIGCASRFSFHLFLQMDKRITWVQNLLWCLWEMKLRIRRMFLWSSSSPHRAQSLFRYILLQSWPNESNVQTVYPNRVWYQQSLNGLSTGIIWNTQSKSYMMSLTEQCLGIPN